MTRDVQDVIEGKADMEYHDVVDVRDVARAHILAAELPAAKGRYIVAPDYVLPPQDLAELLSRHFPGYIFKAHKPFPVRRYADNSKVQPACP